MHKYLPSIAVVLWGLLSLSASAAIVVTEFMYNPSLSEPSWEWIEIHNNGPLSEDLENWTVEDSIGSSFTIATAPFSISPGSYVVLTSQTLVDFNTEWNTLLTTSQHRDIVGSTSLNNASGDDIIIYDELAAEQFSITYTDAILEGQAYAYNGYTDAPQSEIEDISNWTEAIWLSESVTANSGDWGSPGAYNGPAVPEPSTGVLFIIGGILLRMRLKQQRFV